MQTFAQTFEKTLTAHDSKHHLPFQVIVPAGTTQVDIELAYAPQIVGSIHNLLTLTVFDPTGWRGAGHRHGALHQVHIAADAASPGYLAGTIQPGRWIVEVDVHWVMTGPAVTMRLTVRGTDDPTGPPAPRPAPGQTAPRGPGWYRGDLHAHTVHSDADWDVAGLTRFAREHHLDFATLSDHNTVSGLAEMDAARTDDLLTIGGIELTTFWGHALCLGVRDWVDWRTQAGGEFLGERTMATIEREVTARGGLFIIAHPTAEGDPFCTGCQWHYPEVNPGQARVVEVWNDDWSSSSFNEDCLKLVYGWLNQGLKLALTAGADNHGRGQADRAHFGFNVVYADALTEAAVLNAVRAGHLYVSAGPDLNFTASAGGRTVGMGDRLAAGPGESIQWAAEWRNSPPGAQISWVVDGEIRDQAPAEGQGGRTWTLSGDQAHWSLITLRAADGIMLALTNPIFIGAAALEQRAD